MIFYIFATDTGINPLEIIAHIETTARVRVKSYSLNEGVYSFEVTEMPDNRVYKNYTRGRGVYTISRKH